MICGARPLYEPKAPWRKPLTDGAPARRLPQDLCLTTVTGVVRRSASGAWACSPARVLQAASTVRWLRMTLRIISPRIVTITPALPTIDVTIVVVSDHPASTLSRCRSAGSTAGWRCVDRRLARLRPSPERLFGPQGVPSRAATPRARRRRGPTNNALRRDASPLECSGRFRHGSRGLATRIIRPTSARGDGRPLPGITSVATFSEDLTCVPATIWSQCGRGSDGFVIQVLERSPTFKHVELEHMQHLRARNISQPHDETSGPPTARSPREYRNMTAARHARLFFRLAHEALATTRFCLIQLVHEHLPGVSAHREPWTGTPESSWATATPAVVES